MIKKLLNQYVFGICYSTTVLLTPVILLLFLGWSSVLHRIIVEMPQPTVVSLTNKLIISPIAQPILTTLSNSYTFLELDHLIDVRHIVLILLVFWGASLLGILLISWKHPLTSFIPLLKKLSLANLVTVGLMLFFVLVLWNQIFTLFHLVLFPQGNWQFSSDSLLIQLFPPLFWFISAGVWLSGVITIHSFVYYLARKRVKN